MEIYHEAKAMGLDVERLNNGQKDNQLADMVEIEKAPLGVRTFLSVV